MARCRAAEGWEFRSSPARRRPVRPRRPGGATKPLATVALAFTPPAYFALGVLGLSVVAGLSGGSLLKGFIAAGLGLMLAMVGPDPISGVPRFTFGEPDLLGGIKPLLVMIGLFAVTEMLVQIGEPPWAKADAAQARLKLPNAAMMKRLFKPTAIGSVIGTFRRHAGRGDHRRLHGYSEAKRGRRRRRNSARDRRKAWPPPNAPTMSSPRRRWCRC
jgi:putative tricarboxylic transport membrane protein